MSSNRGGRSPEDGARNAVMLALQPAESAVTGQFFQDYAAAEW